MDPITDLKYVIDHTLFIDTHEHLLEESQRLAGSGSGAPLFTCDDWAYLFAHYALDDLRIAGMSTKDADLFMSATVSPVDKWRLFEPYWPFIRHTGYGKAVLISINKLYGLQDVSENTVTVLTDMLRSGVRKGYYFHVLRDIALIESCQVNSLDCVFRETEYPDLLMQDISTTIMGSDLNIEQLMSATGMPITNFSECHNAIDAYFDKYGRVAVAVKNQSAYNRRLNYDKVSYAEANPFFERLVSKPGSINSFEMKAVQDHLWRYTVQKATEYNLPVKLHTGYFAGTGYMPLGRVSQNLKDLCPVLQDFPETRFVLMHIAYPYQDELIAIAKQYKNVYVDLCWAWIVNPVATVRFVKEFLMAVPANKLFTFGGDYTAVENVVGHAEIARKGLWQALTELVDEDWLSITEASNLVEPLMRGNAYTCFNLRKKLMPG